jgi:hypothetical protein
MAIPAENEITSILAQYQSSFSAKVYSDENNDHDVLMDVFGVTPELKRQNRQYWGRELGMCWQLLVAALFKATRSDFAPGYSDGADELCDLMAGTDAIDTKYRIGSGDSGTLKKFKQYGQKLAGEGLSPIFLIVREDNLPAAMTACDVGGWTVYTGSESFAYIEKMTGVDLHKFLSDNVGAFEINR